MVIAVGFLLVCLMMIWQSFPKNYENTEHTDNTEFVE